MNKNVEGALVSQAISLAWMKASAIFYLAAIIYAKAKVLTLSTWQNII